MRLFFKAASTFIGIDNLALVNCLRDSVATTHDILK